MLNFLTNDIMFDRGELHEIKSCYERFIKCSAESEDVIACYETSVETKIDERDRDPVWQTIPESGHFEKVESDWIRSYIIRKQHLNSIKLGFTSFSYADAVMLFCPDFCIAQPVKGKPISGGTVTFKTKSNESFRSYDMGYDGACGTFYQVGNCRLLFTLPVCCL